MIDFHGVTKVYPNRVVGLDNVSLSIAKGEFAFVVGPSGAGKSTLIRLIYREETADQGRVVVAGKNLAQMRRQQVPFFRRGIGVVFQDFKLLPDRDVFDNVAFALEVTDVPRREILRRVPGVLDMVGLAHKIHDLPNQLSGGEQQRVAIARAIVRNPSIVLADEPTGNLDPETSWSIMRLLLEINRIGATVVVATHAKQIVNALRRRVIALEDGRVVRDEPEGGYGGIAD